MQVHKWEVKALNFIREAEKVAISQIRGVTSNEKEQEKKPIIEEGVKSISSRRRVSSARGLELRLQGGPSVGGRLLSLVDELKIREEEDVIEDDKEVNKAAFVEGEEVAHRARG